MYMCACLSLMQAEELIVTPEEREDLEYLKGRMRRKP